MEGCEFLLTSNKQSDYHETGENDVSESGANELNFMGFMSAISVHRWIPKHKYF